MNWIGGLIVAVFLLGLLLGNWRRSTLSESTQTEDSHAKKLNYPTTDDVKTSIATIARSQVASAKDVYAKSKADASHNKRNYRISGLTAVGVAVYTLFTAIIVVVNFAQYNETHRFDKKQLSIIKGQLDVMANSSSPAVVVTDIQIFNIPNNRLINAPGYNDRIYNILPKGPIALGMNVQNVGKTYTNILRVIFGHHVGDTMPVTRQSFSQGANVDTIAKDSEVKWIVLPEAPLEIAEEEKVSINDRKTTLWVYGSVCYTDLLGQHKGHRFIVQWFGKDGIDFRKNGPAAYSGDHLEDCE